EAADVKELFAIDLADYPSKEGRMIEVSYPPGAQGVVHRHDAHALVYVREGEIGMQLKGQAAVTLKAGQTFYEGPTDVHVVGRNASNTERASVVVVCRRGTCCDRLIGSSHSTGCGRNWLRSTARWGGHRSIRNC